MSPGRPLRRAAPPVLLARLTLLTLLCALPARRVLCGERQDGMIEDMLLRAESLEAPTAEDRMVAARALRDWRLSERTAPTGDNRIGRLLETIAAGEEPPEWVRPVAAELRRDCFTEWGRSRRSHQGWSESGRPRTPFDDGDGTGRLPEADGTGQWLLLLSCTGIIVMGLVVWVALRHRRNTGYDNYYS